MIDDLLRFKSRWRCESRHSKFGHRCRRKLHTKGLHEGFGHSWRTKKVVADAGV